jgi:hypothetical protein
MTFPQTKAEDAILGGQEYWRLFTELESSGDIFEAPVSARAITVGPDSDISRIDLTYYDNQSANLATLLNVSIDKPLIGRVDALFSTPYQSGDRARVLLSTADLLPPTGYEPSGYDSDDDILQIVQPRIDLSYYLNEEPDFIPPRSDGSHLFERLPIPTASLPFAFDIYYVVPFYGRRFAEVTFKNMGIAGSVEVTCTIFGVNFSNIITDITITDNGHQQEQLGQVVIAAALAGAGNTDSVTVVNRAWDALVVQIDPTDPFVTQQALTTHVVTSDKV